MNNVDLIIQIVLLIIGSGVLGYLGHYLQKHHRAVHFANGLEHAQTLANAIVARIANDSTLAIGQRRTAVVRELQTVLDKHGYHLDVKRLEGIAEYTYQTYKQSGFKVITPVKTPAPTIDNTIDSPKPNTNSTSTHPVSNLTDDEMNVLNAYRSNKAKAKA